MAYSLSQKSLHQRGFSGKALAAASFYGVDRLLEFVATTNPTGENRHFNNVVISNLICDYHEIAVGEMQRKVRLATAYRNMTSPSELDDDYKSYVIGAQMALLMFYDFNGDNVANFENWKYRVQSLHQILGCHGVAPVATWNSTEFDPKYNFPYYNEQGILVFQTIPDNANAATKILRDATFMNGLYRTKNKYRGLYIVVGSMTQSLRRHGFEGTITGADLVSFMKGHIKDEVPVFCTEYANNMAQEVHARSIASLYNYINMEYGQDGDVEALTPNVMDYYTGRSLSATSGRQMK